MSFNEPGGSLGLPSAARFAGSDADSVRQWTFEPFLSNGQPIEVETTIGITYSLAK